MRGNSTKTQMLLSTAKAQCSVYLLGNICNVVGIYGSQRSSFDILDKINCTASLNCTIADEVNEKKTFISQWQSTCFRKDIYYTMLMHLKCPKYIRLILFTKQWLLFNKTFYKLTPVRLIYCVINDLSRKQISWQLDISGRHRRPWVGT